MTNKVDFDFEIIDIIVNNNGVSVHCPEGLTNTAELDSAAALPSIYNLELFSSLFSCVFWFVCFLFFFKHTCRSKSKHEVKKDPNIRTLLKNLIM